MRKRRTPHPIHTGKWPNRIREWRERRGLSQDALADRLAEMFPDARSFGRYTLSEWETEKYPIKLDYMRMAAAALDVSVADLLAPEDNPCPLSPEEKEVFELIRQIPGEEQREEALRAVASLARSLAPPPGGLMRTPRAG